MTQPMPGSIKEWCSCFCGKLPSMSVLRNAFVQLLKYCFSDTSHYSYLEDQLGCLVYDPDGKSGSIKIQATGAIDPSDSDNIPGIVVSFGEGILYQMPSLQDWQVTSSDFSQTTSYALGEAKVLFKCNAYDADISCAMADACMMFIMGAKPRILLAWGRWIKDIRVTQVTDPKLALNEQTDSSVVWYETSVLVTIQLEYAVDVVQESKRLSGSVINSRIDTLHKLS